MDQVTRRRTLLHVARYVLSRQGDVIHATWSPPHKPGVKRRTVETACGRKRAQLLGVTTVDAAGNETGCMTLLWPPYVADLPAGSVRCPECMKSAPGKPQRPDFLNAVGVVSHD